MSNLVLYSIPAFIALILLELAYTRRHRELAGYEPLDTLASMSMGVLNIIVSGGAKLLSIPFFAWVYSIPYACSGESRTITRRSATIAARYSSQFSSSPDTAR